MATPPQPDSARRPDVVVALLTPFDASGRLDIGALAAHVQMLLAAGVDAVMPCGTTGEGPLLAAEEVTEVIRASSEAASRGRVLAHVGRPDTPTTVRLARRALADGADGISAVVPYYYALTDEQILTHFRAVVAAAGEHPAYA